MSAATELPRAYPRYEVNAYVDCTGAEVLLYHRLKNISLGGICLATATVEDPGTVVEIVVNFPELDATVGMRGEVVWSRRDAGEMGIRYLDLDDDRRDTLRRYLSLLAKTKQA